MTSLHKAVTINILSVDDISCVWRVCVYGEVALFIVVVLTFGGRSVPNRWAMECELLFPDVFVLIRIFQYLSTWVHENFLIMDKEWKGKENLDGLRVQSLRHNNQPLFFELHDDNKVLNVVLCCVHSINCLVIVSPTQSVEKLLCVIIASVCWQI